MAINITKDMIEAVCPSAATPDEQLFIAISAYFAEAESQLRFLASDTIIDSIKNSIDLSAPASDLNEQLWQSSLRYIIAKAYYEAIPHLDLVLTQTGFGVVSNQNVAPASADRVERLRNQMKSQWMLYFEDILTLLRKSDTWHQYPQACSYYSLFWHSRFLSCLGIINPTLEDLVANRKEITSAEVELKRLLSPEFYSELVTAEMTDCVSPSQSIVISFCRNFIASAVSDRDSRWIHRELLLRYLNEHVDEFPTYKASTAYSANNFRPYENKKDDTCYFFG